MSDKVYLVCCIVDGNLQQRIMFNSLFTMKVYLKQNSHLCGEEWQFNSAGIGNKTGLYFMVDNDNIIVTDKPPWINNEASIV